MTSGWNGAPIRSENQPAFSSCQWYQGKASSISLPRAVGESARVPSGSWVSTRLNMPPSETKGQAASCHTVICHEHLHPWVTSGLPVEQDLFRRNVGSDDACYLAFQANHFWVGRVETGLLWIYGFMKLTDPNAERHHQNGHLSQTVEMFLFGVFADLKPRLHHDLSWHFTS